MSQPETNLPAKPTVADWVARTVFFVIMALVMISMPMPPANELDASWRMVLSKAFQEGMQFGVDVVFTYGPLGFLMGKTYCGIHYNSLIAWQVCSALIFTGIIFRQGLRLTGYRRYFYFGFFLLFGVAYEDALHQMIIGLVGFELLRRHDDPGRWFSLGAGVLLGGLGLFKFTDLMLGSVFVGSVAGLQLWRHRPRSAAWLAGWFAFAFLLGWVLCGQRLLNLPAYFYNSWEISQGYQEAMGIPTPIDGLIVGVIALGLIVTYALCFWRGQTDQARGTATTVALAAYVYLNWKHGFIRADGHMIGFFYAVLVPATAYPHLLDDGARSRRIQAVLTVVLGAFAFAGVGVALPGLFRGLLSTPQERLFGNATKLLNPGDTRGYYEHLLTVELGLYDLPKIRAVVGHGSVDVLGYEQAIALYNKFNYRPRPVFQSYSVYRPHLSHLNLAYYASDRAPDFVLLKLQTIDQRLVTFDDPEVLSLLLHRYEYVLSEKGLQLWRRNPGGFSTASIAPKPLQTATVAVGQPFNAKKFSDRPLWAAVELRPSLLGRLRAIIYKMPIAYLRVQNTQGAVAKYRMPLPQGRTGFIINPIVDDLTSYMQFAGGRVERLLDSLTVEIQPEDRPFFADHYTVRLAELPPSTAGRKFFLDAQKQLFRMFDVVPLSFSAMTPISEGAIDNKPVMVFHAPSEMTLAMPKGATEITGAFGYLEGAYTNGNETDGAVFSISWVLNTEEILLFERQLDPAHRLKDRGLQQFKVALPDRPGGSLILRTSPGPKNNFAWDWTAWTELNIH